MHMLLFTTPYVQSLAVYVTLLGYNDVVKNTQWLLNLKINMQGS